MEQNKEMSIIDLLKAIFKKWYIILSSVVVFVLIVGVITIYIAPPFYSATAKVYLYDIPPKDIAETSTQQFMNSLILKECTNRAYKTSFIQNVNIKMKGQGFDGSKVEDISITTNGNYTFSITAISDNPEKSAALANTSMQELTYTLNRHYVVLIIYPQERAVSPTARYKPDVVLNMSFALVTGSAFGIFIIFMKGSFKKTSKEVKGENHE